MSDAWAEPSRPWVGDRWSLDLRGDELADLRVDGRLVLRAVQAVVRDHDWNTVPLVVDDVRETDGGLTLRLRSAGLGASFEGTLTLVEATEGLGIQLDLVSREAFETNRTGLVVLVPPHVADADARVRRPDGGQDETRFPVAISPHQPMRDIAGLAWDHDDVTVGVAFVGDVFEMEDQRNWTDASFKVYSRPLALPFPYRIEAGEHVVQTIAVTADVHTGAAPEPAAADRIVLAATGTPFPEIVLGASTAPDPAPAPTAEKPDPRRDTSPRQTSRRRSGFSPPNGVAATLVELDLGATNWRAALDRAAASGLPLDVRVITDGPLDELAAALAAHDVTRVGVFDPADHVTHHDAVHHLRAALPGVPVVGGARSHFTQLNREQHRIPVGLDGLTFSVTPLFHATSTAQLVESLAMQRLVAEQAVAIAAGIPVHVGPVTLRPRFNDVATAAPPAPTRDDLADGYGAEIAGDDDPRQSSRELAAWTLASAAALAVAGVASIAFFEEWGPRGIRAADGDPYPVAAAVEALAALEGELLAGDSPDGLVWAVGAGDVVLVANLDDRPRSVTVSIGGRDTVASLPPHAWTHLKELP